MRKQKKPNQKRVMKKQKKLQKKKKEQEKLKKKSRRKKKPASSKNKKILIAGLIAIIIILSVFIITKFDITGKIISKDKQTEQSTQQVQIQPLDAIERQKITGMVLSSEFIDDMPKKGVVGLRFFKFENGQRIWQDGFLIGKNQLLSDGIPDVYVVLHSKYIAELNENQNNLCEIIEKAKKNGDLGFYTEQSKAKLFLKYAGMLKHRKCFGF